MRPTERRQRDEQRFVEGEPDLQPPEELAVAELDEELMLEEDLDCELVAEEEVDQRLLQEMLEDLAHAADDLPSGNLVGPGEFLCRSCFQVRARTALADRFDQVCRACVDGGVPHAMDGSWGARRDPAPPRHHPRS